MCIFLPEQSCHSFLYLCILFGPLPVLQHAARYLANQDWVKGETIKTIENALVSVHHSPLRPLRALSVGSHGGEVGVSGKQLNCDGSEVWPRLLKIHSAVNQLSGLKSQRIDAAALPG